MVDLGTLAFTTKNYDLAADIYEQQLRDFGPSVDTYLALADSLAKSGKLQKAIQNYMTANRVGNIPPERLNHLADSLVDLMHQNKAMKRTNQEEGAGTADKRVDYFACDICKAMWNDPVTVGCGHTFCRSCLERTPLKSCPTCSKTLRNTKLNGLRTNVLLQQVLEKLFSNELQAVKLKSEGNKLFQGKDFEGAVKTYSRALEYAPADHLLVSNRSHAHAAMQHFEEALRDAEVATQLRPDWAKAYFRKGTALEGLSHYEEAAYAYLQCLTLDSEATAARTALTKMLNKILSPIPPEDLKATELQGSHASGGAASITKHSLFSPLLQRNFEKATSCELPSVPRDTEIGSHSISSGNQSELSDSLQGAKSQSLPGSRQSSPLVERRPAARSASDMSINVEAAQRPDSRKRSVNTPLSPTRSPTNSKLKKPNCEAKRRVVRELLCKEDFECSLCMRLLFEPVTTPCGHAFCRSCLDRCLDHNASCPLCKALLVEVLAERQRCTTEAIESIVKVYFPEDFAERKITYERELQDFAKMSADEHQEIPIFVCTIAFPTVACPLHVFEPRYRLMVRKCMESGTRQFGMCACLEDNEEAFADYGCMLEVREVQYLPDGRSVVDTVGGRRFKVLSRASRDGYNTANVEFLYDAPVPPEQAAEVLSLHDEVHREARQWFDALPRGPHTRILQHFGAFPEREQDVLTLRSGAAWTWWVLAVLPLDPRAQLAMIAMTSLRGRLLGIRRVLHFMESQRGPTAAAE